jgi:hypothetical protein
MSKRTLPFPVLLVTFAAAAMAGLACNDDDAQPVRNEDFGAAIDGYLPTESLQDWVDHAAEVAIVVVVSERALDPQPTPHGSDQPAHVGRRITLRVERTIWQSPDAEKPPREFETGDWGWRLEDGELRPTNRARLEVDRSYLVPIVRFRSAWRSMALTAIPVSDGHVETGFPLARPWMTELYGVSIDAIEALLAELEPDPFVVRFVDVPAEDRMGAMWTAIPSFTATAAADGKTPIPTCAPIPGANFSRDPFCVAWDDIFDDETGFTVVVDYGNGAEVLTYDVPANTESYFPPASDGPAEGETLEECLARSNVQVWVTAHRPSGDQELRRSAANFECAGP